MQQQRAESAERHRGPPSPRVLPWQACAQCLPCPTAHLENRSPVRAQGCTRVQQQSTQDPSWCWLLGSSNRKPGFSSWEKHSAPDCRMQVTADTQFPTHVLFLSPNQWFCVNIFFFKRLQLFRLQLLFFFLLQRNTDAARNSFWNSVWGIQRDSQSFLKRIIHVLIPLCRDNNRSYCHQAVSIALPNPTGKFLADRTPLKPMDFHLWRL